LVASLRKRDLVELGVSPRHVEKRKRIGIQVVGEKKGLVNEGGGVSQRRNEE